MERPVVRHTTRERPFAVDPAALYGAVTGHGARAGTALLELGRGATSMARRSFVFPDPAVGVEGRGREVRFAAANACGEAALEALVELLRGAGEVRAASETLHFRAPGAASEGPDAERLRAPSSLDALRALAFGWEPAESGTAAALRAPGVFSYDLIDEFEDLPDYDRDPLEYPDFAHWLPRVYAEIDERTETTRIHRFAYGPGAIESDETAGDVAEARLVEAVDELRTRGEGGAGGAQTAGGAVETDLSDEAYAEIVRELKGEIEAGEAFQVVPSRTFSVECPDPLGAYLRLRRRNPSPYSFYVRREDDTLFGASPETSVRVDASDDTVEIRPIAGTRGRGRSGSGGTIDPIDDACREAELRLDGKELAEHSMLVDLARNDVGRVSRPGTVEVDRLMGVDRFSEVMHLVSHVRGTLEPGLDALHAYAASLNMGTLVGAPKLRAAELLRQHETTARGPYGGAVGFLRGDGSMETAIVIRSAVVPEDRQRARIRTGAGIVADSRPEAEAEETRAKARSVLTAIRGSGDAHGSRTGAPPSDDAEPVDVLLVDNYDSFTFNLADVFGRGDGSVEVWRNDAGAERLVEIVDQLAPPRLVLISPGPGRPETAGCCPELVDRLDGEVPLLGICLGHQVVVRAFGGSLGRADRPMHGKTSRVEHDGTELFDGLQSPLPVARYHSLVATDLPDELEPTARLEGGDTAMAIRHRRAPIAGLQFHPESILTSAGTELVANALDWARRRDGGGERRRPEDDDRELDSARPRRMR